VLPLPLGVPGWYGQHASARQAFTSTRHLFPFHLAPPPLIAPCTENPLPEPAAPPPSGTAPDTGVIWADVAHVRDPEVEPSLEWALWQLVPSPQLGFGDDSARFGLRWQLTPLLYSFALDSRLDRWRWLVAEPIVRHSGSVELFLSPEYLALDGGIGDRFGLRGGLRAYFGLVGRGDNLSVSLGSSYFRFPDHDGISFEAGAYVLFGALGLVLTHSPGFEPAPWLATLRLRYF
jgi:hypothetical protein